MLVAGCAGSAAPASTDDKRPAIALVAEADRLILEWKPNYEHPNRDTDDTFERTDALYTRACERGVARACWRSRAGAHILDNCRAGDVESCRLFTDLSPTAHAYRNIPGTAARDYAWGPRKQVAAGDLRRECEQGLSRSCLFYVKQDPAAKDASTVRRRLMALAGDGCWMGLIDDCAVLRDADTHESIELAETGMCIWTGWCERASELEPDAVRARDLLERGCQMLSLASDCAELARRYANGDFSEPVPGRRDELYGWACPRMSRDSFTRSAYGCPAELEEPDSSDVPAKTRELQVAAINAQIEAAHAAIVSVRSGNDDLGRAIAHLDALHYELVRADRATRRTVSGPVRELFDEAHALHVSNEKLDHVIAELEKVEP